MKQLTKKIYYVTSSATSTVRLWHCCSKKEKARTELNLISTIDKYSTYKCIHCGFEYRLTNKTPITTLARLNKRSWIEKLFGLNK